MLIEEDSDMKSTDLRWIQSVKKCELNKFVSIKNQWIFSNSFAQLVKLNAL